MIRVNISSIETTYSTHERNRRGNLKKKIAEERRKLTETFR